MVDIVDYADSVVKTEEIVNRRKHIVEGNVIRDKVACVIGKSLDKSFIVGNRFQNVGKALNRNVFVNSFLYCIVYVFAYEVFNVDHTVGDNLKLAFGFFGVANHNVCTVYTGGLHCGCLRCVNRFAGIGYNFAGKGVDNRLSQLFALDTGSDTKLFIVFISTYAG